MSTTSTIASYRVGLIARLEAHPTIVADGIQVADEWQGPDTRDEGIYLTDVRFTNELTSFRQSRQPRVELFEVTVVIQAAQASSSPQDHDAAFARVWELYAALQDVVYGAEDIDEELFGQVTTGEYVGVPVGPGWGGRLSAVVGVQADLD